MENKRGMFEDGDDTRRRLDRMTAMLYRLQLGMEEIKVKLAALSRTAALQAERGGAADGEKGENGE